jgi:hypothetical protein
VSIQLLYTNALTRPAGPAVFARAFFAAMQLDRSFAHSNLTFVLRDSLQAGAAFVKTRIATGFKITAAPGGVARSGGEARLSRI